MPEIVFMSCRQQGGVKKEVDRKLKNTLCSIKLTFNACFKHPATSYNALQLHEMTKYHLATLPHLYVYPEKIYPCLWLSPSGTWWRYWLRHRFKHTRQAGIDAIHRELDGPEGKKISHWFWDKTGAQSLQHRSSAFPLCYFFSWKKKSSAMPKRDLDSPRAWKQRTDWSL